jgi:hypothetical protein
MYNVLRKIHLHTGLILVVFLMMYFASGYVMAHRPVEAKGTFLYLRFSRLAAVAHAFQKRSGLDPKDIRQIQRVLNGPAETATISRSVASSLKRCLLCRMQTSCPGRWPR